MPEQTGPVSIMILSWSVVELATYERKKDCDCKENNSTTNDESEERNRVVQRSQRYRVAKCHELIVALCLNDSSKNHCRQHQTKDDAV